MGWLPTSIYSGASLTDVRIDGLRAGETYTLVAIGMYVGDLPSAPYRITMPADRAESNAPSLADLQKKAMGFLGSSWVELSFQALDDTTISSIKVTVGGEVIADHPSIDQVRIWTDLPNCGTLSEPARYTFDVPSSHWGKLLNVTVEVADPFGNRATLSKMVQF